ncbi:MAG: assimilatory sulfite reductase (NADPH) flavoprotein subunit [Puniceicoccales bacterium]
MSNSNSTPIPHSPLTPENQQILRSLVDSSSPDQILWMAGYMAGALSGSGAAVSPSAGGASAAPAKKVPLTILYATESGNSEALADEAKKQATKKGFAAKIVDMAEVDPSDLVKVENLMVIASTWGEGDPPDRATSFYEKFDADGAPKLENTRFSVLALGDTSYEQFCKFGKDLDTRFEALGAQRFYPRMDCDVEFEEPFQNWFTGAIEALLKDVGQPAPVEVSVAAGAQPPPVEVAYSKKNPFPAPLLERVNLNGKGSAKETWHLEFSLEGSGLSYEAGDALGVYPQNCPQYVGEMLRVTGLDGDELVRVGEEKVALRASLLRNLDVTNLSKPMLAKYQEKAESAKLGALLEEGGTALKDFLWGRQMIDILEEFPIKGLGPQDLADLFRKLPPRLYSIASSMKAHPDEVHLTVAAVRYNTHGRARKGVCSTYFADLIERGDTSQVYFHANKNFRLPQNPDTPVIMVGPGTGVAPFRAFIEERAATDAKGKNWLFFGDQHFQSDFLYQLEWQDYLKDGVLDRMDVAFSRDTPEKVYVQHKMKERAKDLYAWLEEGAHFYVCGDASRMAKDVATALQEVVAEQGGMSSEDAAAYVKQLKKDKRYQQDVY